MRTLKTRNFLLAACCILALAACKGGQGGQNGQGKKPPTNRTLPEAVAAAYKEDAARLAVREANTSTTTTSTENEAHIPQARIDFFYGLLSKAYWIWVDTDTIPDLSGIHTLAIPNLRRINVTLKPDAEFKSNWSQGVTMTSDLHLNQIMSRYQLKIKDYRDTPTGPMLVLESPKNINTPLLSEILRHQQGFKSAEPETMIGDGNNIEYGGEGKNQTALKFSIGAGDCPSGCIERKYWIFYVGPTGDLTYMGTRGEIPAELEPRN